MKKTLIAFSSAAVTLFPLIASAQSAQTIYTVISNFVNQLIPFMLALALLAFFWGMVKYIWAAGNAEGQADGKKIMIAGIVGLFVMVAIWGLVNIIANTFAISTGGTQTAPGVTR